MQRVQAGRFMLVAHTNSFAFTPIFKTLTVLNSRHSEGLTCVTLTVNRGLVHGRFHDQHGTVIASVAQEGLIRVTR